MTTDDVKRVILKWHATKGAWPTRQELERALLDEGFVVDQASLDDLLEMLGLAHQVWAQNGVFVAKE